MLSVVFYSITVLHHLPQRFLVKIAKNTFVYLIKSSGKLGTFLLQNAEIERTG